VDNQALQGKKTQPFAPKGASPCPTDSLQGIPYSHTLFVLGLCPKPQGIYARMMMYFFSWPTILGN
jgi:hypothetical protein